MDNLDFDMHYNQNRSLLGVVIGDDSDVDTELLNFLQKKSALEHALCVFEPLRDWCVESVTLSQELSSPKSIYYMRYGLGRRFQMIFESFRSILAVCPPERDTSLSLDESKPLTRDVNIIYMNLIGALDNFAWCLLFEKGFTEADCHKNNVSLFSPKYRRLPFYRSISDLERYDEWYKELRGRRDPVAHRIPLSIVPAVYTPEEAERFRTLSEQHLQAGAALDFQSAEEKMSEIDRLGKFSGFFVHHPEDPIYPIYPTIPGDLANLVRIGNIVKGALLEGDQGESANE